MNQTNGEMENSTLSLEGNLFQGNMNIFKKYLI